MKQLLENIVAAIYTGIVLGVLASAFWSAPIWAAVPPPSANYACPPGSENHCCDPNTEHCCKYLEAIGYQQCCVDGEPNSSFPNYCIPQGWQHPCCASPCWQNEPVCCQAKHENCCQEGVLNPIPPCTAESCANVDCTQCDATTSEEYCCYPAGNNPIGVCQPINAQHPCCQSSCAGAFPGCGLCTGVDDASCCDQAGAPLSVCEFALNCCATSCFANNPLCTTCTSSVTNQLEYCCPDGPEGDLNPGCVPTDSTHPCCAAPCIANNSNDPDAGNAVRALCCMPSVETCCPGAQFPCTEAECFNWRLANGCPCSTLNTCCSSVDSSQVSGNCGGVVSPGHACCYYPCAASYPECCDVSTDAAKQAYCCPPIPGSSCANNQACVDYFNSGSCPVVCDPDLDNPNVGDNCCSSASVGFVAPTTPCTVGDCAGHPCYKLSTEWANIKAVIESAANLAGQDGVPVLSGLQTVFAAAPQEDPPATPYQQHAYIGALLTHLVHWNTASFAGPQTRFQVIQSIVLFFQSILLANSGIDPAVIAPATFLSDLQNIDIGISGLVNLESTQQTLGESSLSAAISILDDVLIPDIKVAAIANIKTKITYWTNLTSGASVLFLPVAARLQAVRAITAATVAHPTELGVLNGMIDQLKGLNPVNGNYMIEGALKQAYNMAAAEGTDTGQLFGDDSIESNTTELMKQVKDLFASARELGAPGSVDPTTKIGMMNAIITRINQTLEADLISGGDDPPSIQLSRLLLNDVQEVVGTGGISQALQDEINAIMVLVNAVAAQPSDPLDPTTEQVIYDDIVSALDRIAISWNEVDAQARFDEIYSAAELISPDPANRSGQLQRILDVIEAGRNYALEIESVYDQIIGYIQSATPFKVVGDMLYADTKLETITNSYSEGLVVSEREDVVTDYFPDSISQSSKPEHHEAGVILGDILDQLWQIAPEAIGKQPSVGAQSIVGRNQLLGTIEERLRLYGGLDEPDDTQMAIRRLSAIYIIILGAFEDDPDEKEVRDLIRAIGEVICKLGREEDVSGMPLMEQVDATGGACPLEEQPSPSLDPTQQRIVSDALDAISETLFDISIIPLWASMIRDAAREAHTQVGAIVIQALSLEEKTVQVASLVNGFFGGKSSEVIEHLRRGIIDALDLVAPFKDYYVADQSEKYNFNVRLKKSGLTAERIAELAIREEIEEYVAGVADTAKGDDVEANLLGKQELVSILSVVQMMASPSQVEVVTGEGRIAALSTIREHIFGILEGFGGDLQDLYDLIKFEMDKIRNMYNNGAFEGEDSPEQELWERLFGVEQTSGTTTEAKKTSGILGTIIASAPYSQGGKPKAREKLWRIWKYSQGVASLPVAEGASDATLRSLRHQRINLVVNYAQDLARIEISATGQMFIAAQSFGAAFGMLEASIAGIAGADAAMKVQEMTDKVMGAVDKAESIVSTVVNVLAFIEEVQAQTAGGKTKKRPEEEGGMADQLRKTQCILRSIKGKPCE